MNACELIIDAKKLSAYCLLFSNSSTLLIYLIVFGTVNAVFSY